MKTKLLALGLIIAAMPMIAQTPRLSLYEEFTGENCGPCASTNPLLSNILYSSANISKVVAIKWQVPIPTAPTNTWSLYRTNKADIDWRYNSAPAGYGYTSQWDSTSSVANGIKSAPSGLFDGQYQWKFGAANNHAGNVKNSTIAKAQSYTSPFSVTMIKEWDQNMTALTLTVNIVASQNFTATGPLVFRAVMIEKLIQFSVAPGNNGEKKFESAAIAAFPTLQGGTALAGSWVTGQSKTFTLNCPIPSYTRNKLQVDMVGFIQDDGNRKVAQAARGTECELQNLTLTSQTVVCEGQSAKLTVAGATSYSWSTKETGSSINVSPEETTNYWVMSTDANACSNIAAITVSVSTCAGVKESRANLLSVEIYPNPNKGEFVISTDFIAGNTNLVIFNAIGQKVYEQVLTPGETVVKTNLASGLYNYKVSGGSHQVNTGKLVIE